MQTHDDIRTESSMSLHDQLQTNAECRRLLGKIKHLRSDAVTCTLAADATIRHWREEARSYSAELASELLMLNPDIQAVP